MKIITLLFLMFTSLIVNAQDSTAFVDRYVFPEKSYALIGGEYYFVTADEYSQTIDVLVAEDTTGAILKYETWDYPCCVASVDSFDFQILGLLPLQMRFEMVYFDINYVRGKRDAYIYTGYGWRKEEGDGQITVECKE